MLVDYGGLLDDGGGLQPALKNILSKMKSYHRPALVFIADRIIPTGRRRELDGVVFSPLPALGRSEVRQLTGLLLREASVEYTRDELEMLTDLADGHPFNVGFMVQAIRAYTLPVFASDPGELVQIKRKRSSGISFLRLYFPM